MLNAATILKNLSVPAHQHVYLIGRSAHGVVTFLSQQQRALNLIWALASEDQLKDDTKVAVIGGGLAGMTAALAASRIGCQVSLFEEKPELMHLQRGSQQRYVHPNIYRWPAPESSQYTTNLPLLNWSAGSAADIADTVWWQWEQLSDNIAIHLQHRLTSIANGPKGPILTFSGHNYIQEQFDIALIAVGFGIERTKSKLPFLSYWQNDNFGRPIIVGPIPRRYLLSGCGDGGLIDAVRLCLQNLDQPAFTKLLLREVPEDIKEQLLRAEQRAREIEREEWARERLDSKTALTYRKEDILASMRGQVLAEEYSKLDLSELVKKINRALHTDREIILNGMHSSPFLLRASIFNRFALHLLLKSDAKLTYIPGKLRIKKIGKSSGLITVRLKPQKLSSTIVQAHEVIIRHGSNDVLPKLFSEKVLAELKDVDETIGQQLTEPHYPANFLKTGRLTDFKRRVLLRHAANNVGQLLPAIGLNTASAGEITVSLHQKEVKYNLRVSRSSRPPASFEDIPVFVQGEPIPFSKDIVKAREMQPGLQIGFWSNGRLKAASTVGCLVAKDSSPAILTIAGGQVETDMKVSQPAEEQRLIGRVSEQRAPVPLYHSTDAAASLISSNSFAGTLIHLDIGVKHSNRLLSVPNITCLTATGQVKRHQKVYKIGSEGVTRGIITSVNSNFEVDLDGPCWFHEVFLVEPEHDDFANPADIGALIVNEKGEGIGLLLGMNGVSAVAIPLDRLLDIYQCALI